MLLTIASIVCFTIATCESMLLDGEITAATRYRSSGRSRSYSRRYSSSSSSSDWDDETAFIVWAVIMSIVGFVAVFVTVYSMYRRRAIARPITLWITGISCIIGCALVLAAGYILQIEEEGFTSVVIALSVVGAFILIATPYLLLHYVKRTEFSDDASTIYFTDLTGELVKLSFEGQPEFSQWHNANARVTNSDVKGHTYDVSVIQRDNSDDVVITGLSRDNLVVDDLRNRGT